MLFLDESENMETKPIKDTQRNTNSCHDFKPFQFQANIKDKEIAWGYHFY